MSKPRKRERPYAKLKTTSAYDDALAGLHSLQLEEQKLRDSLYAGAALEQILLELVETQESAMELLRKWEGILHKHQGQPPQQQHLTWQEQLQATRSSRGVDSQAGKINNCIRMLQDATEADVLLAASLTPAAWRQYSNEMVCRLMPLIDMAEKPWLASLYSPTTSAPVAAAAAATTRVAASAQAATPSEASLTMAPATATLLAAAAAGSAVGPPAVAADAMTEDMVLPAQAVWQEIESVFDEYFKYGFLSLFVNPTALVEACATNFATGQPAAAPPQHWHALIRRLNPTDEQLQHIKVGLQLHERVDAGLQQRITPVIEKAVDATPLLQMTQEHSMLSSTSAASTTALQSGRGPPPASQTDIASKVAIVTAAAAAAGQEVDSADEDASSLDVLLQRAVRYKHLNMVTTAFIVNNTFTKLQGCVGMVAAWPFGPVAVAVAQACVEELEHRQRQRQQQLQEQPTRRTWKTPQQEKSGEPEGRQPGLQSEQGGEMQSNTAAGGYNDTSWPSLPELIHRNAHYHMKQRVAELRARQDAWHQQQGSLS